MSACAACHAAGYCPSSESQARLIEVPLQANLEVGQTVTVVIEDAFAHMAICLVYVLPTLLLMAALFFFNWLFDAKEIPTALAALATIGIYFGGFALFKSRLKKMFHAEIVVPT